MMRLWTILEPTQMTLCEDTAKIFVIGSWTYERDSRKIDVIVLYSNSVLYFLRIYLFLNIELQLMAIV